MLNLERIIIQDFRNITLQELEFCPKLNCISGGNGEGKTNLLDAIWYLSMTKSALSPSDRFVTRHGCKGFGLSGTYRLDKDKTTRISIQVSEDGKKMKRDDKPYSRMAEHIGLLPTVMVSPADSSLVEDSGEERRRFANSVLSQMDGAYLNSVQKYNNLLAQRNRILKDSPGETALLDILDERLECTAIPIHEARKNLCAQLKPLVGKYHSLISGQSENVDIDYRSDIEKGPLSGLLRETRERDIALKYTSSGIQRDDFLFTLDGYPIRRCGSQGQQKSFLVALKFAQYEIMESHCERKPILLLDDLFDKLDMSRVSNLLGTVSGSGFGQIFLSESNKTRVHEMMSGIKTEKRYYVAEGGTFHYE